MKFKFEGTIAEWRSLVGGINAQAGLSDVLVVDDEAAERRFVAMEAEAAEEEAFMARAHELAVAGMVAQEAAPPSAAEPAKAKRRSKAEMEAARAAEAAAKAPTITPEPATEEFQMDEPAAELPTEAVVRAKVAAAMQADRARAVAVLKNYAKAFSDIPATSYPALMGELAWC